MEVIAVLTLICSSIAAATGLWGVYTRGPAMRVQATGPGQWAVSSQRPRRSVVVRRIFNRSSHTVRYYQTAIAPTDVAPGGEYRINLFLEPESSRHFSLSFTGSEAKPRLTLVKDSRFSLASDYDLVVKE